MDNFSSPTSFLTTSAEPIQCRTCLANVWKADVIGFKILLDPTALTTKEELVNRLHGRRHFTTHAHSDTFILTLRKLSDITNPEPDTFCLVQHDCRFPTFAIHRNFYQLPPVSVPVESEGFPF